MPFRFHPGPKDAETRARRGTLETPHGRVETPAFMPVGTRASVTGLTPADVREAGAEIILGNTYHLLLRPGPEAFRTLGGIHRFMRWDGPVLTDSGGFQIFSLSHDRVITEAGARFRSYVDGRPQLLTPESSIAMQTAIGSDVMMVLDVCLPSTAEAPEIRAAMERTHRWALRSLAARTNPEQALFAIVQGGLDPALRAASAGFLTQHPFDGFAIGGLAVGDTRDERGDVVARAAELLPPDRPRYLMGVGTPPDLLEAIGHGVDMFDCILPTTLAWQGTAFTSTGRVRLTRTEHRLSELPLDAACACETCRGWSRAYLHHLFKCREPLGPRLVSVHNLRHYLDLMRGARAAIEAGRYGAYQRERLEALDRHEHDRSARPPGRRRLPEAPASPGAPAVAAPPEGARFHLVVTSLGAPAVRDAESGEVMHPVIGPAVEAERLYVAQSRLRERLAEPGPPLVLLDVGLGAGANALAALRAAAAAPPGGRALELVSFERDLGALALAASDDGAARLGLAPEDVAAARALLRDGAWGSGRARWRLVLGDLLETLPRQDLRADVIFWDPFSPRANPGLWTLAAFGAAWARSGPRCALYTYSTATATRSALLLAGFRVGVGDPSGPKEQTTAAATHPALLARPLDARWLARLERSSAPFPPDAPPDALARVRAHPQFAARREEEVA
ncbi:tRNA guanosine(34) transglycosylase Tgt [Anaeromyxobacter sp. Red801]|uniref:tRNA guanosine(34) transglycosylase Tgt n=1 Tax=Anaeromyxobacter sp. Red801 TaxID=3411632 RepID=UPI003B9E4B1C